ncbi:Panacea domain-containing protein [Vogesella indigofera]|uniref:Panacea domain-containing protein n=1 Tax=Vogesella indigofera TaxID=45465 RepID=UPI0035B30B12
MAKLSDILYYIMANYPNKSDISNARLTKIVYLADWKMSLDKKKQLTNINWYFDNYGPFVWDVKNCIDENPNIFTQEQTFNSFGSKKIQFGILDRCYTPEIDDEEKILLDFVISSTSPLNWDSFINLVYSTYPITSSERYSHLNLIEKAIEYRT